MTTDIFVVNALGDHAKCSAFKDWGLLSVPVSLTPGDVLMWFRPDTMRTMIWAGHAATTPQAIAAGDQPNPRPSSRAWRETVRGDEAPWTAAEIAAVEMFRLALLERGQQGSGSDATEVTAKGRARQVFLSEEADLCVADAVSAANNANELSRQLMAALNLVAEGLRRD